MNIMIIFATVEILPVAPETAVGVTVVNQDKTGRKSFPAAAFPPRAGRKKRENEKKTFIAAPHSGRFTTFVRKLYKIHTAFWGLAHRKQQPTNAKNHI